MKIIMEGWRKYIKEGTSREIQGVHPLIDGMYLGNGTSPSAFKRVPSAVEIMKANPDVEEFKLALSIMNDGSPVPYLPFGFEKKLARALATAGADPMDVEEVEDFGARDDDEYRPSPSSDWDW